MTSSAWGSQCEKTLFLSAHRTAGSREVGTLGWNVSCQGAVLKAELDSAVFNGNLGYVMSKMRAEHLSGVMISVSIAGDMFTCH